MIIICWISIVLNLVCAACFLMSLNGMKEKTGRDMSRIIGNLFLIVGAAGSVTLIIDLPILSLVLTSIPALIVCRLFFRMIKES